MERIWLERTPTASPASLAAGLGVPEILARHMAARGISSLEDGARFLDPKLANLADPKRMAGMQAAVARLAGAVARKETVALYGDYDVDGVTSTSLMALVLRAYGLDPILHIPHRIKDGYGLNHAAVLDLKAQGASLIITLDCGVTAVAEVQTAVDAGVDVVVVDHHTVPVTLPPAVAVLNPHRPDCGFPYKDLCAVGVTFFLCVALRTALKDAGMGPGPDLREHLDLVALGTVADMVPLTGQNRILVAQGLKVLRRASRPGIAALLGVSGVKPEDVESETLGFQLGPRVNAAGRLQDAMVGVRCLLAANAEQALPLARELDQENKNRRGTEKECVTSALERAASEKVHEGARALVLMDESWHPGVVGIAAQRMVQAFHKPAILVGAGGKGSGRSIEAFHLHAALGVCSQHLDGFGGHAHAAGVRLDPRKLDAFRDALYTHAMQVLQPQDMVPRTHHDGVLPTAWLRDDLLEALARAAPFGRGNHEPLFLMTMPPRSWRVVGETHLQLDFGGGIKGIAFGQAERQDILAAPAEYLCTPRHETWNGVRRIKLTVKDLRAVEGVG